MIAGPVKIRQLGYGFVAQLLAPRLACRVLTAVETQPNGCYYFKATCVQVPAVLSSSESLAVGAKHLALCSCMYKCIALGHQGAGAKSCWCLMESMELAV